MLITLANKTDLFEDELFNKLLGPSDGLCLSGKSLPLAFRANPFHAQGYILESDVQKAGGNIHNSWTVLPIDDWLSLLAKHDKHITW